LQQLKRFGDIYYYHTIATMSGSHPPVIDTTTSTHDSQLGVHQLADASQLHQEHLSDSNLPPERVAELVNEEIEEESGGIDGLGPLEGRFAFFIFEDNKYDSPEHPNKIFVPKGSPSPKDFCDLVKDVFGTENQYKVCWKGPEGQDMEFSDTVNEVVIPYDDRNAVISVRRIPNNSNNNAQ